MRGESGGRDTPRRRRAVVVALFLGLRQRADALEAQYDAQRPIIVPAHPRVRLLTLQGGGDVIEIPLEHDFNLTGASNIVRLANVGAGVAMNVQGVVFGPKLSEPGPTPETPSHSLSVAAPLPPGLLLEVLAKQGGLTIQGSDQIVRGEKLYAPAPVPVPMQSASGESSGSVSPAQYRLTLTYHDLFGRMHASIYDYTWEKVWEIRKVERAITKDLDGVTRLRRRSRWGLPC
jgi:hypothetical protein